LTNSVIIRPLPSIVTGELGRHFQSGGENASSYRWERDDRAKWQDRLLDNRACGCSERVLSNPDCGVERHSFGFVQGDREDHQGLKPVRPVSLECGTGLFYAQIDISHSLTFCGIIRPGVKNHLSFAIIWFLASNNCTLKFLRDKNILPGGKLDWS
jgi:hypothetical protein